ncbi:MAG: hypothetical protein IPJ47_10175 [Anaerolineales bacterium]|nr:hypothetical protein [Anaerolineales bacterium]
MLCTLFTKHGDTIYVGAILLFGIAHLCGSWLAPCPHVRTDTSGLVLEDMVAALNVSKPKFLYVVPTPFKTKRANHPRKNAAKLVKLAKNSSFLILADEVYRVLSYTQAPPKSFGAYIDSRTCDFAGVILEDPCPRFAAGVAANSPVYCTRNHLMRHVRQRGGMNPFPSTIVRSLIGSGLDRNLSALLDVLGKRVRVMSELLQKHIPQAQFILHMADIFWLHVHGMDAKNCAKAQAHKVDLRHGILFSSANGLNEHFRLSVSHCRRGSY